MKTEHTPGPWTIHNNIGRKGELGIMAEATPYIIAIMGNQKEWPLEANANARLIAAAPELLEALRDGIEKANDVITGGRHGRDAAECELLLWMKQARTALARATGEAEP